MTNTEIVILVFTVLFLIPIVGHIIYGLLCGRKNKSVEYEAQLGKWSGESLKDKLVECYKCGVFIRKEKAGKVKTSFFGIEYYCKVCMPKYDETEYYWKTANRTEKRYYKTERFEVDNNGERIAINK